jgi:uncharacterized protein (DUF302 family)
MSEPIEVNNGIKITISTHDVNTTCNRLEKIITDKGMNIIARINHTAGAEKIGQQLRPTELIIFGNPQAGTPLMQNSQSIAIDLPQKILVTEDEKSIVQLSYNDPEYIGLRHGIEGCEDLIGKIQIALESIVKEAALDN